MLGLNLNTNIPFSPISEVIYHAATPEEEVDAVTGNKEVNTPFFKVSVFLKLHHNNINPVPVNFIG